MKAKLALRNITAALVLCVPALSCASPFNDWQPTPHCQYLCGGFYAPPIQGYNDKLSLSADSIEFSLDKTVYLKGDVALFWREHEIHAHDIELIQHPEHRWDAIHTNQPFLYQTPLWAFYGEQAYFQREPEYMRLENAYYRYYPHHAHGKASLLEATKTHMLLLNADYSTCHPDNPSWQIRAKSIKLKPEQGRASARNISLHLKDVPVLYWPYINYPIDNQRHSGFLFPNISSTTQSGVNMTIPYYWNIAPNQDALFGLRWMSERGPEWQTQYRYLTKHHSGKIVHHILFEDNKFDEFQRINRANPPPGIEQNDPRVQALDANTTRQGLLINHHSAWGDYWRGVIHFEWVSDDNYFIDLGQDLHTSSQHQLPQRAIVTYQSPHWSHEWGLEEYQILQPLTSTVNEELYKRQPFWQFNGYYPNLWHNFSTSITGQVINFTHGADPVTLETVTTGTRTSLSPRLSYYHSWAQNYIHPSVALHWRYYDLLRGVNEKSLPDNEHIVIPEYSVDAGLYFERQQAWDDKFYTHAIMPRLYYVYIPHTDQSTLPIFDSGIISYLKDTLYTPNRFLGQDRIGDTHQITVGLQSIVFGDQPYRNYMHVEIAQIFYFADRKEQICDRDLGQFACLPSEEDLSRDHSDLLVAFDWYGGNIHTGFWSQWDVTEARIEQSALYATYIPNSQTRFNMYYTWTRQDFTPQPDTTIFKSNLQQVDFSGFFRLHPRWQAVFRSLFDIKTTQFADVVMGLEYNSCCMAFQAVGNRYRLPNNLSQPTDYANGIFLQVAFKGLSTIPFNQADSHLKQKIPGYTPFGSRIKGHVLPN